MCNRVANVYEMRELVKILDLGIDDIGQKETRYQPAFVVNGFTRPYLPVILPVRESVNLDALKWGLVPHWVKDPSNFKASTLNARNDELFEKPSYKNYWKNRCLVVVSGFFEPRDRTLAGQPGVASRVQKTESWFIRHAVEPVLTLGGLYCDDTVTIITTDTSPMMSRVHNDGLRMPLIFDDEELRDRWLLADLSREEMSDMMATHPDDSRLEAYRTIDGIFNHNVDTNIPEANLPNPDPESWTRPKSRS